MGEIIRALSRDHEELLRSLQSLERQVQTLEGGGAFDRSEINRVLEESFGFLLQAQARKVDLILERLRARNVAAAEMLACLRLEHEEVIALLSALIAAGEALLPDSRVAREAFTRTARQLLEAFAWHLQHLEQRLLPMALVALTAEDWAEVDAALAASDRPPAAERARG